MANSETAPSAGKKLDVGRKAPADPKPLDAKSTKSGRQPFSGRTKKIALAAVVLVAACAGGLGWWLMQPKALGPVFASGNGRIEGTEIDVAPKIAGRLTDIFVNEGDFVKSGQVVAQHQADSTVAKKQLARTAALEKKGWTTQQKLDRDLSVERSSAAGVSTATAQVAAAASAIVTAQAQVVGARSAIVAARAAIAVIQSNIDDSALRSPRDGRVQYRVAELSEVIAAGGVVLTIVDLTDVYMTFFLADAQAGKIAMGQDARLVLDAAPLFVIPATISFVAAVAQFTPKTVETKSERESLMFRLRARIDPALLKKHLAEVKTGVTGMAYLRLDAAEPWPDRLAVRLPK